MGPPHHIRGFNPSRRGRASGSNPRQNLGARPQRRLLAQEAADYGGGYGGGGYGDYGGGSADEIAARAEAGGERIDRERAARGAARKVSSKATEPTAGPTAWAEESGRGEGSRMFAGGSCGGSPGGR